MTFSVPHDFVSIINLSLIGIISAGAAGASKDIDLNSSYGTVGESYIQHVQSDTLTLYNFTGLADKWAEINIAPLFASLSANDHCGLLINHNGIGGAIYYLGINLRYN